MPGQVYKRCRAQLGDLVLPRLWIMKIALNDAEVLTKLAEPFAAPGRPNQCNDLASLSRQLPHHARSNEPGRTRDENSEPSSSRTHLHTIRTKPQQGLSSR